MNADDDGAHAAVETADGQTERPAQPGPGAAGPDHRDRLAGERTFLAWIRTALAPDAGAVAVVNAGAAAASTRRPAGLAAGCPASRSRRGSPPPRC
jgi:uncharacterized membrane protein YidH (DUF202 family)